MIFFLLRRTLCRKFSQCSSASLKHRSVKPSCGINDELYGLSEEEHTFRETIFQFCRRELAPYTQGIDKSDGWDKQKEFWRKLGDMDLLGVTAPRKYGGLGGSYFQQFLVFEEMSRVSPAIGLSYGAHSNLCVNQLSLNASDEQKRRFFPKLFSGEHIGALAMSEVGSGSDVVSMKLKAEYCGDYYVLNGTKFWITNGPDADVIIVYARTRDDCPPEHGVTTFIVERGMAGFTSMPKLDKLGMRGSNTGELVFEDCKVPRENIIGKVNGGIYVLFKGLDIERALAAGGALGVMQACIDLISQYIHSSENTNSHNKDFLAKTLSNMITQLSVCRAYAYAVVRAIDAGKLVSKDCAGCALYATEKATQMAVEAMQCLSVQGYDKSHPVNRFLRDAKLLEIGGGTNEIRRWLIGRRINEEYG